MIDMHINDVSRSRFSFFFVILMILVTANVYWFSSYERQIIERGVNTEGQRVSRENDPSFGCAHR